MHSQRQFAELVPHITAPCSEVPIGVRGGTSQQRGRRCRRAPVGQREPKRPKVAHLKNQTLPGTVREEEGSFPVRLESGELDFSAGDLFDPDRSRKRGLGEHVVGAVFGTGCGWTAGGYDRHSIGKLLDGWL